ncbi:unnamed protein product [Camellia sinensis]
MKKSRAPEEDEEISPDMSMDDEFNEGIGPKKFSYAELFHATIKFGDEQKLGEGGFHNHLFKENNVLTWAKRYKIAQGLASTLLYLHEGWDQCVVHRDVKSSNMMLDSNFNVKLGDFGLSRFVDHGKDAKTINVAATKGYMAFECLLTGKVIKESEVYSFLVVALEIACGRKPIDLKVPKSQTILAEWVWDLYATNRLLEAPDPKIYADFVQEEMECLMIVGLWCAHPDHNLRPSIRQAIHVLNFEASLPILLTKMLVPTYVTPPSEYSFVFGTRGYMAPKCLITSKENKELDVYSFGVVALEIACGRKPIDLEVPESQMRMVEWVSNLYGTTMLLEAALDPKICPNFVKEEMECLMIVGLWCGHPDHNLQPSIRQAIHVLNFEATLPILPANMSVPTYLAPPMNASSLVYGSTTVSNSNQVQSSSHSYNTNSSKGFPSPISLTKKNESVVQTPFDPG